MTDPLARYAWKRQEYDYVPQSGTYWCRACHSLTSNRNRHDAKCPHRKRDTTRLKPSYAPDPWRQ